MTNPSPQPSALHDRVADLAVTASDGGLPLDAVLVGSSSFAELGMSSLSFLRLIDSLENEFGVYIDLEEAAGTLGTVRGLVRYMEDQGVGPHAG
ncbi:MULTISPECIES: acyl carrier protein [unclassified Kitasatospora]|uniref:acyl carrier protein n=1 Tax=unclassified Kitasatospora TaxID=2633591 RepID=UPI0038002949